MESQFGRQFGASEADIARQQAGMESAFGRSLTAVGQLPGIQNAMDMRRRSAIGHLGGVGSAYEQLSTKTITRSDCKISIWSDKHPCNNYNNTLDLLVQ